MNNKFDELADNISGINSIGQRYGECDENGVSAWYFQEDYEKFIESERSSEAVEFEVNGEMYYEHWFFTNEKDASSVVGYSLLSERGDVKFCVVGARTDFVCDFDTMYKYLTDRYYFVE